MFTLGKPGFEAMQAELEGLGGQWLMKKPALPLT